MKFILFRFPPTLLPTLMPPLLPVLLLLTACTTQNSTAPTMVFTPPAQFKEAAPWPEKDNIVPDEWWTLFADPVLNDLERRVVLGNENLKIMAVQVAGARAALEASRSAQLPTLSAGLNGTRSNSSGSNVGSGGNNSNSGNNGGINGSGTNTNGGIPFSTSRTSNNFALTTNASWEIDLWGRLSQAEKGAGATLQASQADLAAARLSVEALLAQTYFSLRTGEAQLALTDRAVAAYTQSLALTQARYDAGVAGRTDILQAQSQLKTTQAQRAELLAQRALLEHAIAVLLGIAPAELALEINGALPTLPTVPVVPQLLPASLLQRRPDILAAQSRLAAAYAQIGVTEAAWLPVLNLTAGAGYRSSTLSQLIKSSNMVWSLGSSLTQAVFDGGQRKLASAQARAGAVQLTATYRQIVLTALQEVEDNLALAWQLQQETQFQAEALQGAQQNVDIALEQYRAGTVSYLNVIVAQAAALNSESSLLTMRNRQLAASSQLLKNIAGRWEGM